eukprot:6197478-Pleurochrysis_carterae.AAC.4
MPPTSAPRSSRSLSHARRKGGATGGRKESELGHGGKRERGWPVTASCVDALTGVPGGARCSANGTRGAEQ